jgi:hypothetical protein
MKTWIKVALVTALFALPAMALGQVIWPPDPANPTPSGVQLPFFILLSVFEAVAFGLGISFLLFGFPPAQTPAAAERRACAELEYRTMALNG